MTTQESLKYLIDKALKYGYTERQIAAFAYEVQEKIAEIPVTDKEELDELFDQIF